MAGKVNNAEGGTNGSAVNSTDTASGDKWNIATPGTGGTLNWDNTHAAHGSLGIKVATGATSTSAYAAWTSLAITVLRFRANVWLPSATPSVTQVIARGLASSAQKFRLYVNTLGQIVLGDSANSTVVTLTTHVTASQFLRFEGSITVGTSAAWEIRYYASVDSQTATETKTGSTGNFLAGNFDEVRFGTGANFANVVAYWLDDLGIDDSTFLGPAALTINPSGLAVPVGIGSLALADGSMAIAPTGKAVSVALGSLGIADGSMAVTPSGLAVPVSRGALVLADGSMAAAPSGLAVPVALGALTAGVPPAVDPNGIAEAITLGTPTLGQSLSIAPSGIPKAIALGTPALGQSQTAAPSGIAKTITLGTLALSNGSMGITPAGIPVAVTFGQTVVSQSYAVTPAGIDITTATGTPGVAQVLAESPDGVGVPVALGSVALDAGLTVAPAGAAAAITLGSVALTQTLAGPPGRGTSSLTSPTSSVGLLTRRSGVSLVDRSAVLDR